MKNASTNEKPKKTETGDDISSGVIPSANFSELADLKERGQINVPYVVEVNGPGGQNMVFYGSEHRFDPADEQVEDITRRWADFYESHPDAVIMVEGNYDQLSVEDTRDRDTAILNFGEHGLMVHLARQAGVEVLSPEPNGSELEQQLISEFGQDQVVLQRTLAHITEVGKKILDGQTLDMEQEISEFLAQYSRESVDGRVMPYGIHDIEDIYRDLFPDGTMIFTPAQYDTDLPDSYINEIDPIYAKKIAGNPYLVKVFDIAVAAYNLFNPEQDKCVLNEITRRADDLRNIHIAQQVQSQWSKGRSIFAVYGWSHAAHLEPALKALIKA